MSPREIRLIETLGGIRAHILPPLRSAAMDLDPSLVVSDEVRREAFSALVAALNSLGEATRP